MVITRDNSNMVLVFFIQDSPAAELPSIVDDGLIPNTVGLPAVDPVPVPVPIPVPVPVPVPGVEPGEPVDGVPALPGLEG